MPRQSPGRPLVRYSPPPATLCRRERASVRVLTTYPAASTSNPRATPTNPSMNRPTTARIAPAAISQPPALRWLSARIVRTSAGCVRARAPLRPDGGDYHGDDYGDGDCCGIHGDFPAMRVIPAMPARPGPAVRQHLASREQRNMAKIPGLVTFPTPTGGKKWPQPPDLGQFPQLNAWLNAPPWHFR